jgi:hypothetical protein
MMFTPIDMPVALSNKILKILNIKNKTVNIHIFFNKNTKISFLAYTIHVCMQCIVVKPLKIVFLVF